MLKDLTLTNSMQVSSMQVSSMQSFNWKRMLPGLMERLNLLRPRSLIMQLLLSYFL